jgi:hypothetical protein
MAVFIDFPSGTGNTGEKGEKGDKGDTLYSVKFDTVLAASNWSSDGTYKITSNEIDADSLVDIGLQQTITETQIDSFLAGKIVATDQGDGYITLTAYDDVPTEDIPITVVIEGSQLETKVVEKVSGGETDYGTIAVSNDNEITISTAIGKKHTYTFETTPPENPTTTYSIVHRNHVGEVFNYGDKCYDYYEVFNADGTAHTDGIFGGPIITGTSKPSANGAFSHAEGYNSTADGNYSHSQNQWTIASSDA